MTDIPMEPSAELRTAALQLRQMFVALTASGFSEPQALAIIGYAISSNHNRSSDGG